MCVCVRKEHITPKNHVFWVQFFEIAFLKSYLVASTWSSVTCAYLINLLRAYRRKRVAYGLYLQPFTVCHGW